MAHHALSLPGTERCTYYGGPGVRVAANGRTFLNQSREADSFHLAIDHDSKAMLMDTDPASFWQTPHYDGWPGVLVRYASADPERVAEWIDRARGQAAARTPAAKRK